MVHLVARAAVSKTANIGASRTGFNRCAPKAPAATAVPAKNAPRAKNRWDVMFFADLFTSSYPLLLRDSQPRLIGSRLAAYGFR